MVLIPNSRVINKPKTDYKQINKKADKANSPVCSLLILLSTEKRLSRHFYPVIEEAAYTEEQYACGADCKGELGVAVALERRQRIFRVLDVHRLDDKQIVVKADYRIYQSYEHHEVSKR